MKKPLFVMLGITAPLALLSAASAQAPEAAVAAPPQVVQIQTTVDYVTTSLANALKTSARIAPGKDHDALLLAALRKAGAEDEQGPQVITSSGVTGRFGLATQTVPPLTSFLQVKPRVNKNGSITVEMTCHRETLSPVVSPGAISPTTETSEVSSTDTFTDGQTLMVNRTSTGTGGTVTPPVLLIFARVKSIAAPLLCPVAAPPPHRP